VPTFSIPGGPTISYRDSGGEGVPIIFSHGLFMSKDMFAPQFAEFTKDHRCIVWDERGHGETVWDGGDFTYWDSADDLLALADHLGIDRFIHFGFSQGGLLALRAAIKSPDRFIGLIQCSTQARGLAGDGADAFRAYIQEWIDGGPTEDKIEFLINLILGPQLKPEDEAFWVEYWKTLTPQQLTDALSALYSSEDIEDQLHAITAPVVVIHGLKDVSTPLELALNVPKLVPDHRGTLLVEEGPHALNLTHAEQANEFTRAFVDEVTSEFEKTAAGV